MDQERFVGREAELALLRAAWDRARGGTGSIVAVNGEAGIGKTRLAEELADHAEATGGRVLWGRAEELAGAPPYWPWVEVIRDLLAEPELDERLVSAAAHAALLVPELRDRFPGVVEDAPSSDPDRRRWLLLDGVSQLLWTAADGRPTTVVLDDLHWADESTGLLLQHFARGIGERPVLLVLAYRPEAVSNQHPIAKTLGDLNRYRWFERIEMSGLTRDQVRAYLAARLDGLPTEELTDSAMSRTGGNPFFLRELAAAAARSSPAVGDRGRRPAHADASSRLAWIENALPQGIREAAAASLGLLSNGARAVLNWASLLGEEFAVTDLVAASQLPRIEVLAALEESRRAGILREQARTASYRFVHALLRDALLAEISAPQQAQLHAQVAMHLETAPGPSPTSAADRLAYHFGRAAEADPTFAAKAIEYSSQAAERAVRLSAWGEAIQHCERAIGLARREETFRDSRAPLLVMLGAAQFAAGDSASAHGNFREGIREFRRSGRVVEAAEATLTWLSLSHQYPTPDERRRVVTRALGALADDHESLRAQLLVELITTTDQADAGEALAAEARDLARRNGLPDIEARLARWEAQRLYRQRRWDAYRDKLLEAARRFSDAGDRGSSVGVEVLASSVPIFQGQFDEAVQLDSEQAESAERRGNYAWATLARVRIALIEIQRGDRERASAVLDAAPLGPREHGPHAIARAWLAELEGDVTGARTILDAVPPGVGFPESWLPAARARLSLIEDDLAGARRHLALWEALFAFDSHQTPGCVSLGLLEQAVTVPPQQRREELLELAATWDGFRFSAYGGFDRLRGLLARSLNRIDEAEQHFRAGRDWALSERCDAEAGRCDLELSEVAERRGRHADAVRFARSAVDRLRAHGGVLDVQAAQQRLGALHPLGWEAEGAAGLLTPREIEVLRYVAAGETNSQIAGRLVISPHTVANHVKNILAKTESANRTEAAAYALANGLVARGGSG